MKRYRLIIVSLALLWISIPNVHAYCGDGVLESAREACDDGNFEARDGCSSYCELEDITPPRVTSVSIADNAEGVPTNTQTITVTFSEPLDSTTVNANAFSLTHQGQPIPFTLNVGEDQKTVFVRLQDPLFSASTHSLRIKSVKDSLGNAMTQEFIRLFATAVHVDEIPPFVVTDPPAGIYGFPQNISFIAYQSESKVRLEFIETATVRIYYTLDGTYPTENSILYSGSFLIGEHQAVKFFGIDASNNKSRVFTQVYQFECSERPNAKTVTPYPECKILECNPNFEFRNNTCVPRLGTASGNYRDNAFTAPLFSSDTPLMVNSKSAIHITPEHQGLIRRPIIFRNLKRETEVQFDRDTLITDAEGKPFTGYLVPPIGRFSKDFPINFGFSFKSILEFTSPDGQSLSFNKPFKVAVTLTDRFESDKPISVFTLVPDTNQYERMDSNRFLVDWETKKATILADKTGVFFVSQPGENFTKAEFNDMENHWAKNYAEALYRRGIVKGRSKGIYAPDEPLTRAEFTKIALESIGADIPDIESVEDAPFPDVFPIAWYAAYVKEAKDLGLISGYPDGTFRPEQPINRAEAIKILIVALGFNLDEITNFKGEETFSDIAPDTWYYSTVNFVIRHQLLDGLRTPNGTVLTDFGPGRNITRGEMAKLAIRTLELHESRMADE